MSSDHQITIEQENNEALDFKYREENDMLQDFCRACVKKLDEIILDQQKIIENLNAVLSGDRTPEEQWTADLIKDGHYE